MSLIGRQNSPRLPQSVDISLPTGWDAVADETPTNSTELATALVKATVEAALSSSHYIIELDHTVTYTGTFVIDNSGYVGTNWIIIRSSAFASLPAGTRVTDATNMPTILQSGSTACMRIEWGSHHIRFIGIEFTTSAAVTSVNLVGFDNTNAVPAVQADVCDNVGYDRCFIHSTSAPNRCRVGVQSNCDNFFVIDSRIDNIKDTSDAQAILLRLGTGIHIENCFLEATGEIILAGGNDNIIEGSLPTDLTILRSHLFKRDVWNQRGPSFNEHPDTGININFISVTEANVDGFEQFDGQTLITTADSNIAITAITNSGGGFTSIEKTGHGIVVGEWITVAGVTPSGYNKSHLVTAVTDSNNFVTSVAYISDSTVHGTYRPEHILRVGQVIKLESTEPVGYRGRHQVVHIVDADSVITDQTWTSDSTTPGTYRWLKGWGIKNIFEMKMVHRVRMSGCVLENNWLGGQTGFAILLTTRNQSGGNIWAQITDVLIENCVVKRSGRGVKILIKDTINLNVSKNMERVTFRNCLFHSNGGLIADTEDFGVQGKTFVIDPDYSISHAPLKDFMIDHCTFVFQEGHLGGNHWTPGGGGGDDNIYVKGITVIHNIWDDGEFDSFGAQIDASPVQVSDRIITNNGIFFNPAANAYASRINAANFAAAWGDEANIKADTITDVKFTDNANQDYTLASDSPFKFPANGADDGKDFGVDFVELNKAIDGVV